jgi:hypothetical protein
MTEATRGRLAAGCAIIVSLCLALCLGSGVVAEAWLRSPLVFGSTDYIYACAGVNFPGRFRVGIAWNSNLAGLTPLYAVMPETACGYFPRPPFLPPYGMRIYQP